MNICHPNLIVGKDPLGGLCWFECFGDNLYHKYLPQAYPKKKLETNLYHEFLHSFVELSLYFLLRDPKPPGLLWNQTLLSLIPFILPHMLPRLRPFSRPQTKGRQCSHYTGHTRGSRKAAFCQELSS